MTRNQRQRSRERIEWAKENYRREQANIPEEGIPSEYDRIKGQQFLQDNPHLGVVGMGRGSGKRQRYSPQLLHLKKWCSKNGNPVVGSLGSHESGRSLEPGHRPGLYQALEKARGKVLLVCDLTRLVRNPEFDPKTNANAGPTVEQLERLQALGEELDVTFVTLNDPDATPEAGRAYIQRINDRASKAGRKRKRYPGYMKDRREKLRGKARKLYKQGLGLRRIVKELSKLCEIPPTCMTVKRWIQGLKPAPCR